MAILLPALCFGECKNNSEKNNSKKIISSVVSLSPSITFQVSELGAGQCLSGVTSYHPPLDRDVPVVGTLINPSIETVIRLKPDAVLLSEEDSAVQKTGMLIASGLRVVKFSSNRNFNDIAENYIRLGRLLGREKTARKKIAEYRRELQKIKVNDQIPAVFLLSCRPFVTVSSGSFLHALMKDAGYRNVFAHLASPYPVISREAAVNAGAAVVFTTEKSCIDVMKRYFYEKKKRVLFIEPEDIALYTPVHYIRGVSALKDTALSVKAL